MSRHLIYPLSVATLAGCIAAVAGWLYAQEEIPAPPGGAASDDYQIQTHGPVHEAFANPYTTDPVAGLVVEKEPPPPVEEVPPEVVPEGDNVIWVPGYWGWDPRQSDFLWISGVWRDVPPNRRWVPGYWADVERGFQWISGFWTTREAEELSYLPYPPESLEQGPGAPPPSGDYFWVPGCWLWVEADFRWRPGYWAPAQESWVWVPDYYVWTPYGCTFVAGYWDYQLPQRGVLFCPVQFTAPVYTQPNFRYTPAVTVSTSQLLIHLFVSPRYHHYYFGDYYAADFNRLQIVPWYAYAQRRTLYDPLLTHYQWSYGRRDINFVQRIQIWNQFFVENEDYRPRRTFKAQQEFAARFEGQENVPVNQAVIAHSLKEVVQREGDRRQFRQLNQQRRQEFAQGTEHFRRIRQARNELERAGDEAARPGRGEDGRVARGPRDRRLELPQAVKTLRPQTPAEDRAPGAPDAREGQPGDETQRGPQLPPPARPPMDDQPQRGPRAGDDQRPMPPAGRQPREGDDRPGREPQERPPGEREPRPDRPGVTPGEQPMPPAPGRGDADRDRGRRGEGQPPAPQPRPNVPGQPGTDRGQEDRPGLPGGDPRQLPGRDEDRGRDPRQRPPGLTPDGRQQPQLQPGQPGQQPGDFRGLRDRDGRDRDRAPQFPRFGFQPQPDRQQPDRQQPGNIPGRDGRQFAPRGNDPLQSLPPGYQNRGRQQGQPGGQPPGLNRGGAPAQPPAARGGGRGGPPQPQGIPGGGRPGAGAPGGGRPQAAPPRGGGNPGGGQPQGNPGRGGERDD